MSTQKIKIVFIGNSNVGKTTLLQTYLQNKFTPSENSTLGLENYVRNYKSISFIIHNSIPHSYFKEADHFILVFDPIDNRSEIEKQLRYWLNSVTNNNKIADKITIIAHNKGNKNAHDFENANTTKEIVEQEITKFNKDYEQTLQHRFFRIDGLKNDDETSLQTLNGIFQNIMEDFANNVDEFINVNTNIVLLDEESNSNSSKCRC